MLNTSLLIRLIIAAVVVNIPAASQAQSATLLVQRHRFDIHVQPLSSALRQLAAQSGVRILFPYDDVAQLRCRRVEGWLTTHDALRRLLAGTRLRIEETESGVVALAVPPAHAIIGRHASEDRNFG